jgi:hypothetical protein
MFIPYLVFANIIILIQRVMYLALGEMHHDKLFLIFNVLSYCQDERLHESIVAKAP